MGWEKISDRADFLGLTLFHKVHCNLTRPLLNSCMSGYSSRIVNQKSVLTYSQFPFKGVNFSNIFFPLMMHKWNMLHLQLKEKNIDEFKSDLKNTYKPKRYKFYSRGDKYKCSLLTRIRVR